MGYIIGLMITAPVILLCAVIISALMKHTKKAAEPALTPRDLQVLQESAEEIVKSIESAADEAMRRFDEARDSLERLVARAEKAAEFLEARMAPSQPGRIGSGDRMGDVVRLSNAGLPAADIARKLEMGTGEVELLLSLRPRLQEAHG